MNALRMAGGVADGDMPEAAVASEDDAVQRLSLRPRLEVAVEVPRGERRRETTFRKSLAPAVVVDQAEALRQVVQVVVCCRPPALHVVVMEGHEDDREALASFAVGDAVAIARRDVLDRRRLHRSRYLTCFRQGLPPPYQADAGLGRPAEGERLMIGGVIVAVVGGEEAPPRALAQAEAVGRELARRGCTLICGGRGGGMEGGCRGAR